MAVGALCTWEQLKVGAKEPPCLSFVTLPQLCHPQPDPGGCRELQNTLLVFPAPGKSHFSYCRRIHVTFWTLSTSQGATNSPKMGEGRREGSPGDPQRTLPEPGVGPAWDGQDNLGTFHFE